ncbi:pyrroline-5-carboxylate reductase [Pseudomonas sp. SGAir0191]|uniref:NAD(P)-binding domain-containing protein n=1 Tax=Pseudomonas sp. SGAir0191 TaxID=2217867 RepID=UPI000C2BB1B0|nr:NAD(P)-binding domain-containing protein [Pseudomonas sp. SGAir0191]AUA33503.1 pyrroline-5-carboxylate reductase [Pseudomonas sp. SGAir0191]
MKNIGIIGVGGLAEKLVVGLRRQGFSLPVHLSPRGYERSSSLSKQEACVIMGSNQAVVESSDVILLCVPARAIDQLAKEITVRQGQIVISAVAGVGHDRLERLFPGATCVRVLLSFSDQHSRAISVLWPEDEGCTHLLSMLGRVLAVSGEREFELATVAACMSGWFLFLMHDLHEWLVDNGLCPSQAHQLVVSNFQDSISMAASIPSSNLRALGEQASTPGTFSAKGLNVLRHQQVSAPWGAACEVVLDALLNRM